MTGFEYFNPVRMMFGEGTFGRLGECILRAERHALLVTGRGSARKLGYIDRAVEMLQAAGTEVTVFDQIPPNPTDEVVDQGGALAREVECDVVIGLGGGSAMDAAKGIAVAATHDFPVREFLVADSAGNKRVPTDSTLPIICVTTTAGTSSELTPFAVITTLEATQKNAIGDHHCYARVGICDPELTYAVPAEVTAATGVDILCHAVEGYVSTKAGPLTDHAAEQAIALVGQYLPRLMGDLGDREARHYMSLANVFAGIPLSNCGANIMHGLEHPVSAHLPEVAHGAGLASLLVAYAQTCHGIAPEKFTRISVLLGGPDDPAATAEAFEALLQKVGLDIGLSHLGVEAGLLDTLADDALRYMGGAISSTPGCPDKDCLLAILQASL